MGRRGLPGVARVSEQRRAFFQRADIDQPQRSEKAARMTALQHDPHRLEDVLKVDADSR
jgi:hypothetical protein